MKFAQAYIDLDDKDRAFEWLNRAVDERDWDVLTLGFSPEFDGLRADPRFGELIRRAGVVGAP